MIALAQRERRQSDPYSGIVFEEDYFSYYPINLQSFESHQATTWPSLTSKEILRWLLLNWGIELHHRVALRKLRGQSKSTFRIRPSDRGLEVIDVPQATHTRPRFRQAFRILKDIGALQRTDMSVWVPSELGLTILELGDAP